MSQYLNALKIIDKVIPGGLSPSTGGSTKCREHGCNCVISNGDFDTFKSTNKTCTRCGHFYYNHDLFLWVLKIQHFNYKNKLSLNYYY